MNNNWGIRELQEFFFFFNAAVTKQQACLICDSCSQKHSTWILPELLIDRISITLIFHSFNV